MFLLFFRRAEMSKVCKVWLKLKCRMEQEESLQESSVQFMQTPPSETICYISRFILPFLFPHALQHCWWLLLSLPFRLRCRCLHSREVFLLVLTILLCLNPLLMARRRTWGCSRRPCPMVWCRPPVRPTGLATAALLARITPFPEAFQLSAPLMRIYRCKQMQ